MLITDTECLAVIWTFSARLTIIEYDGLQKKKSHILECFEYILSEWVKNYANIFT